MKKVILLIITVLTVVSCAEDIQDNRPALQGFIDNSLYRAIDAIAYEDEDGGFLIQGLTQQEDLSIRISSGAEGVYDLGGESLNFATFKDISGNLFRTNPNGEGQVVVSRFDQERKFLTGTFRFEAIQTAIDTIVVNNGIFFEVPIVDFVEVIIPDPVLPEGPCSSGTFVATVNGEPLQQGAFLCVQGVVFENQIVLTATTSNDIIRLRMPVDISESSTFLPNENFNATYTDLQTGVTQDILEDTGNPTGRIIIENHNTINNIIKGTFSFRTENYSITFGGFNISYQQ